MLSAPAVTMPSAPAETMADELEMESARLLPLAETIPVAPRSMTEAPPPSVMTLPRIFSLTEKFRRPHVWPSAIKPTLQYYWYFLPKIRARPPMEPFGRGTTA